MWLFGERSIISFLFATINPATQIVELARDTLDELKNVDKTVKVNYSSTVSFTFVPPSADDDIDEYLKLSESKDEVKLWRSPKSSILLEQANSNHEEDEDEYKDNALLKEIRSVYGDEKPIAVFLPGLDGVGISATNQYQDLAKSFELWRLVIDVNDRSSFHELKQQVNQFINVIGDSSRPMVIIGESFGGLLAPSVAFENLKKRSTTPSQSNLKGLVLVNPATSFDQTQWKNIVPILASIKYLEEQIPIENDGTLPSLYSVLGGIALSATIPDRSQLEWIINLLLDQKVSTLQEFQNVLQEIRNGFGILEDSLPASTLEHRVMNWLTDGTDFIEPRLSSVKLPTLIIAGEEDNLLPTKEEADRLLTRMPNATKISLKNAGHFALDGRINITNIILKSKKINLFNLDVNKKKDYVLEWEKPDPHSESYKKAYDARVAPFKNLVSPVFISTSEDGVRRMGLSNIPSESEKNPLLFVANHQFGGLDMGLFISELIEKRNIYPRGLAHPIIFLGGQQFQGGAKGGEGDEADPADDAEGIFQQFGALPVTPRNYYRLMQTKQTGLLFPGGVREVFHGKDEAYQLFWPEDKVDFVRTAARFNATIIPLSAVGAADSVNILVDAPDMLKLPFVGERLANSSASILPARFDAEGNTTELFAPPFSLPKLPPARHYFLFGTPIRTESIDSKDREACQEVYYGVKKEIERGFEDVLRARKHDPFEDSVKRIAYENLLGKQAPTFSIDEVNK